MKYTKPLFWMVIMFLMFCGTNVAYASSGRESNDFKNDMEIYLRDEAIFQSDEYLLFGTDKSTAQQNEEFYDKIPAGIMQTPVEGGYVKENEYEEICEFTMEIVKGLETDEEKLIAIHDWVADNIYYNHDNLGYDSDDSSGVRNTYKVFKTGTGVCEGYANLTFVMLYACDIESYVIFGGAYSSTVINHAWNLVRLDNNWITMDVTWDSQNDFIDGKKIYGGYGSYNSFRSNEEFSFEHKSIQLMNNIWADDILYTIEQQMLVVKDAKETIVSANILNGTEAIGLSYGYYNSFYNCSKLENVNIPETLKIIGDYAFFRCLNLETINFPNALKKIGQSAFWGCEKIKQIDIPYGLEKISDTSFYSCSQLQYVELPSTVTFIGEDAFANCTSLKEIIIPKGLNSNSTEILGYKTDALVVGFDKFAENVAQTYETGYKQLYEIVINEKFCVDLTKNKVIKIFDSAEIRIPNKVNGISIYSIDEDALATCGESLSKIIVPKTIVEIPPNLFCGFMDILFLVHENSYAYQYAIENNILYELIQAIIGDVFCDETVNSKDSIKLSQYLAKWSVDLTSDEMISADIVTDGLINSKDSIKLAQYLAKWNVSLE